MSNTPLLSVVVPLYNESDVLQPFHTSLLAELEHSVKDNYEVIYCDDGSTDGTGEVVRHLHKSNPRVKLIKFSRNFGKENALSAGIAAANGQAILTIDGDGQHPVELIPQFLNAWKDGAQVVVGIRTNSAEIGFTKNLGSSFFYKIFNKLSEQKLEPGSTDYRLIDKSVQQAFLTLKENSRLTRGLIDWLGFKRAYIAFEAKSRTGGSPGYSKTKLLGLAADSLVSLSPKPLYLFGYLGVFITIAAFLLGAVVFVEQLLLNDPLHWKFSGTAALGIIIMFLVGIVLMSQGILSLYISHIHNQIKGRPLYVIDYSGSLGIKAANEENEN